MGGELYQDWTAAFRLRYSPPKTPDNCPRLQAPSGSAAALLAQMSLIPPSDRSDGTFPKKALAK
jgi:hypothetical protein